MTSANRSFEEMAAGDQSLVEEKHATELRAFDCYMNKMTLYFNPSIMLGKLIAAGLVDGSVMGGGAAVFLPDNLKMQNMLNHVRNNIALNGPKSFELLIEAIKSVTAYRSLAGEMASKYLRYNL